MTGHFDTLETCKLADRETELFSRLPEVLRKAMAAPANAERLRGIDPRTVTGHTALARLPVLRKSDLPALHKAAPSFGGLVPVASQVVLTPVYALRVVTKLQGAVDLVIPGRRRTTARSFRMKAVREKAPNT